MPSPEGGPSPEAPKKPKPLIEPTHDIERFNLSLQGGQNREDQENHFHVEHARAVVDDFYDRNNWEASPEARHDAPEPVPEAQELITTPEQHEALETVKLLTDPETGQNYDSIQLNMPEVADGQSAVEALRGKTGSLFFLPYGNTVESASPNYRAEIVANLSDQPEVVIDAAGMGRSDGLTKAQRKAAKKGDLRPMAAPLVRAVSETGLRDINIFGSSFGGLFAAAFAAEVAAYNEAHPDNAIKIHEMVIVNGVGNKKQFLPKFADNFLRKETARGQIYQHRPDDPKLTAALAAEATRPKPKSTFIEKVRRGLSVDAPYVRGMTHNSLEANLETVLAHDSDTHITLVNGSEDTLSPSSAAADIKADLTEAGYGDNIHTIVMPGMPHFGMGHGKRLGPLVNRIFGDRRYADERARRRAEAAPTEEA